MTDLIDKIEAAQIEGRGGTAFPTARKWRSVMTAADPVRYVVCNGSEGEPGVKKDWVLLSEHTEQVCEGMRLACETIGAKKAWINCNHGYVPLLQEKFDEQIARLAKHGIELIIFQEAENSYISGESSTLMNAIEGKPLQPRNKKQHATEHGMWGKPTLIQNVETFWDVAAVATGTFDHTRLYTISGAVSHPGTYRFPRDWTVRKILEETKNHPEKLYLAHIGGSASGPVWNESQIDQPATGTGSIEVYDHSLSARDLLHRWLGFFHEQSCGKCTPCREGTWQQLKMIEASKSDHDLPWEKLLEVSELQKHTSFCGLGKSIDTPLRSLYDNLVKHD